MNNKETSILGYSVFIEDLNPLIGKPQFETDGEKLIINTINPHSYAESKKDRLFEKALKSSSYLIPDGIGIVLMLRLLKGIKIKRFTGSDLHDLLLEKAEAYHLKVFYFGSAPATLEKIEAKIKQRYPNIKVASYSPPYKESLDEEDNRAALKAINDFAPDILFVGMTAPKQEKWVFSNQSELNASVICSIGAVFDFFAGTKQRSSPFWNSIGLEWLPRLLKEPTRLWKRVFISAPIFFWDAFTKR
ncbi:WecB/TagA/CpsF family glycosyltransferase [Phaeodactylibacter xiamenensis]|uniref:WecB/TagA/CpsF family glycosyltransferase n=1 Tax=Phaeodactylibacter xiamenensis TaxID=1524460 RepID=UPI0024A90560|nr:WecB/TagA/CpsF family glycosyltransferase [Phaeodactylibacter xiamenensis]